MLVSGDCTVILTPSGKSVIIDTGEQENIIVKYLLNRGIKDIDYLMLSHFDSDHCGQTVEILESLKVRNIVISKQAEKSQEFESIMKEVIEHKVNIIIVEAGDILQIEKDVYFQILWPSTDELIKENALNNNSIVAKMYYKDFSMLFTGDIEEIAEQKIVKRYDEIILKSTVLKVPHHGSKTSSTEDFIKKIKSQIALIGVGKDNKFGHPNEDVIKRLQAYGNSIYRTDLQGEITIEVSKSGKIEIQSIIE